MFSDEDKAIIKHYLDKGKVPNRIWMENPEKVWDKTSVKRLCKRIDKYGTTDRDEIILSQESEPGTHVHPRTLADDLDVSHGSIRRMVKRSKINQFKRVKTPHMDDEARSRIDQIWFKPS